MQNLYFKLVYRGRYFQKCVWVIKIAYAIIKNKFSLLFKDKYSNVWIIGAGDDRYENNVRTFYEYMRKTHPDIKIFWIAEKMDRIPIDSSMIVKRGSVKNYLIALNAKVGLYSHTDYDVAPGLYRIIKNRNTKLVFLDHGISGIKAMNFGFWDGVVFDAVCCFSEYERKIKKRCGIPDKCLYTTGYAHSDDYMVALSNNKIKRILVMPTWRDFYINGDKVFENTKLYEVYRELFTDETFKKLCVENGISVTFILHPTFDNYYHCDPMVLKREYGDWVDIITDGKGDMHAKISTSDMLITDYSSLTFDFWFMRKPVLMYCFDWDEFEKKRGLEMTKDKIDTSLCMNKQDLINKSESIICGKENFGQEKMIENFFTYIDRNNCKRIYDMILSL